MVGSHPIIFISDFDKKGKKPGNHKNIVEFDLDIFGENVCYCLHVASKKIKLSEIVPFARELSSKISSIILAKNQEQGMTIPCRKGCAACCKYLVPLSVPEAFRLREEILTMPEKNRKAVLDIFLTSAKKILREKPEDSNLMEINRVSDWYSNLELACPFLSDNTCTNYEKRPIACREYLVRDSEIFCLPGKKDDFHKVDLPFSVLECLGVLSAELEQTEIEALIMPLALPWAQENLDRNEKTWPTLEILHRLRELIEASVTETNMTIPD